MTWDQVSLNTMAFKEEIKGLSFIEIVEKIKNIKNTIYLEIDVLPTELSPEEQMKHFEGLPICVSLIKSSKNGQTLDPLGFLIAKNVLEFTRVAKLYDDIVKERLGQTRH